MVNLYRNFCLTVVILGDSAAIVQNSARSPELGSNDEREVLQ
jgi:hypothetical protein